MRQNMKNNLFKSKTSLLRFWLFVSIITLVTYVPIVLIAYNQYDAYVVYSLNLGLVVIAFNIVMFGILAYYLETK
jgi:uncharacterized membrane protein (DUF485 family)